MESKEFQRFAKAWAACFEIQGRNISGEAIAASFKLLEDYPADLVLQALASHMKDPELGLFPPTPAAIIGRLQNNGKSVKEAKTDVDRAWFNVRHAMQRFGPYQHVKFEDGAIAPAIMAIGGWGYCCNANDMREIERRFKEAYDPSVTSDRMLKGQNGFSDEPNLIAITDTPAVHALPDESENSEAVSPIIRKILA